MKKLFINLYCALIADKKKRDRIRRVLKNQDPTDFLKQQNAELLNQTQDLTMQNAQLSDNIFSLQQFNNNLQAQVLDIQNQYNDAINQYNELKSYYDNAVAQCDGLRNEYGVQMQNLFAACQKQLYTALKLPQYDFKPRKNSVLLIEPNPYHGEIQPGFVKYFQDLGYNVDIFMRLENYLENPFVKYTKNPPRMFFGTAPIIRDWVNGLQGDEYEYVFLSSSAFWNALKEFNGKYLAYLGGVPKSKHGILMIEHNAIPFLHEYDEEKYLAEHRVFALTENNGIPRLNPHYFGEFKIKKFNNKEINFVVVGRIETGVRNHTLLLDTIKELVTNNITNFKVFVVGNGNLDIPDEISKYISVLGRLNYDDMYKTVNNADYVLALLDPSNPDHTRYKTGTTTGSFQLSLGFNKPMVIEQSFASHYNLNKNNSIVYSENDLYIAMLNAIKINPVEYDKICKSLADLESKVYQESLENLKMATVK